MQIIGTGILNWNRAERQTDRYGAVLLLKPDGDGDHTEIKLDVPDGIKGKLIAKVIEPRKSSHIGDIFHGLRQRELPKRDQEFVLGNGTIFVEGRSVGVEPDDGRKTDWLDPKALYQLHDSIVELRVDFGRHLKRCGVSS